MVITNAFPGRRGSSGQAAFMAPRCGRAVGRRYRRAPRPRRRRAVCGTAPSAAG